MPADHHSLTVRARKGRLLQLKTDCEVAESFDLAGGATPPAMCGPFVSLWDTGATATVITQRVVDACGLKPIGMTQVHGVNGIAESEIFIISLRLLNGVGFPNVRVTKGQLQGIDVLIGMDIISMGDFSITSGKGNTVFSFRLPSQHEVDYCGAGSPGRSSASKGPKRQKRPKSFGKNKRK